jgi:hypothetical protein
MHISTSLDKLHAYKSKDETREGFVYNLCVNKNAQYYLVKLALLKASTPLLKNLRVYSKAEESQPFTLIRQFNFFQQVNAAFASHEQKIDPVLPVGHGCHQLHEAENAVPSHTDFGSHGDFSFELVRAEPERESGSSESNINRIVSNERILFDRAHGFSLYEFPDGEAMSRRLLVEDTLTMYTINEQTGECQTKTIKPILDKSEPLLLRDIRLLFILWPKAFESDSDYFDIGTRRERDIRCSVREAVLPVPKPLSNSLKASFAVVTHFVPIHRFFAVKSTELNVPIAIRIAFFADQELTKELGKCFGLQPPSFDLIVINCN